MIRKFAITTLALAAVLAVTSQYRSPSSVTETQDDTLVPAAGDSRTLETAADLAPVQGLRPLPEIIEFWQTRVDGNPTDYPGRTELGFALNTAGAEGADLELYRQAEMAFDDALALNPSYTQARLGLSTSLIAQHRFDEALRQIDLIATPTDTTASQPAAAASPPVLALQGDAHFGIGDYEDAATAYSQLVTAERSAPTVSRLARLRFEQGATDEAVALATEALTLSQDLALRPNAAAFYHFQLGHFLFLSGQAQASIDAYRAALAIDPDHGGAAEGLAFTLAASGDLADAAGAYRTLVERSPAADLHGLYADVLRLQGEDDLAEEQERLGRAAALESRDDAAERRHLVGYYLTRDPGAAVTLARADLADRQDSGGYDALAWALFHDGQYVAAAEAIDSALASGTRHPAVLYHAAAIYNAPESGRPAAEAARFLHDALAIHPTFHPTEAADAQVLADSLIGR